MREGICKECEFFRQHFTKQGARFCEVFCGHCTKKIKKRLYGQEKGCELFVGCEKKEALKKTISESLDSISASLSDLVVLLKDF